MTITAAVPRPERSFPRLSKSIGVSMICSAGTMRTDEPPGITALRLSQPPRTPPQWSLDQFAERDPHRLFDVAGPLDMAGDAKQLGADIVGPADAGEPCRAAPQDVRRNRDRLRHC